MTVPKANFSNFKISLNLRVALLITMGSDPGWCNYYSTGVLPIIV